MQIVKSAIKPKNRFIENKLAFSTKGIFYVLTRILLFSIAFSLIAPQAEAGRGLRGPERDRIIKSQETDPNIEIIREKLKGQSQPVIPAPFTKDPDVIRFLPAVTPHSLRTEAHTNVQIDIRASVEKNGRLLKRDGYGEPEIVLPNSFSNAVLKKIHTNATYSVINKAHSTLISRKSEVSLDNIIASINELKQNLNKPPSAGGGSYKDDLSDISSIDVFPIEPEGNKDALLEVGLKVSPMFIMQVQLNAILHKIQKFNYQLLAPKP